MYSAYHLTAECQKDILKRIPPKYGKVYADHITVQFGNNPQLPAPADEIKAIGVADDGQGIQALLVQVDGKIDRADQSFYHITISLDPEKSPSGIFALPHYKPVLSNVLFQNLLDPTGKIKSDIPKGWTFTRFERPISLEAVPVLRYTSEELNKKNSKSR